MPRIAFLALSAARGCVYVVGVAPHSAGYQPRAAEHGVLYRVIDEHLEMSSPRRHAHIAGFDLHANLAVPAADRARLEQLCRYLLRPPVAQDRLQRLDDDRILLTLKTAWADGTRHLLFAPVVAYGSFPETAAAALNVGGDSDDDTTPPAPPRHWAWANLMRRAFDIDVLACPRCGGRLRLLGTIEDPVAIRAILDSLAMSDALLDRPPPAAVMEPAALATQV